MPRSVRLILHFQNLLNVFCGGICYLRTGKILINTPLLVHKIVIVIHSIILKYIHSPKKVVKSLKLLFRLSLGW